MKGENRKRLAGSVSVFIGKVAAEVGFELAVIGMERGAESRLGGIPLADQIENSLDVAESVGIADVRDCGQTLGVRQGGRGAGKTGEAAFEDVERDVLLCLEKQGQGMAFAIEMSGLKQLSNALVEPRRAAVSGKLGDERVG